MSNNYTAAISTITKTQDGCNTVSVVNFVLVKKGMAMKAFRKYCSTNNISAIKKQVQKGLVKII